MKTKTLIKSTTIIVCCVMAKFLSAQAWSCTSLGGGCYRNGATGIGTYGTPSYMLDVRGFSASGINYTYDGGTGGVSSRIQLGNSWNNKYWRFVLEGNNDGDLKLTDGTGYMQLFFGGVSHKVGIGTSSPSSRFEVSDITNTEILVSSTNAGSNSSFWALNPATGYGLLTDGNGLGHISQDRSSPLHMLNFKWNATYSKPQVWIGKRPTAGHSDFNFAAEKIVANSIYVFTSGWADFVFEKNYNLMPLDKVETFIKKNKHLPSVPSESEIIANGVNVVGMNAILLQKIEELYLYTIELQKQIDDIRKLKNKNTEK